jgi:RHS repeat-associated protein
MQACCTFPTLREDDPESGLMHFRARSYDSRMGRFTQRDPKLAERVAEHFVYGRSNPIRFTDPTGNLAYWIGGAGDKVAFLGMGPTGIMKAVMEKYRDRVSGESRYRGYHQGAEMLREIKEWVRGHPKEEPLILIGHSWGGAAALDLANQLKNEGVVPDLVVTLDAVSMLGTSTENKKLWVNVHRGKGIQDVVAEVPVIGQALGALGAFLFGSAPNNVIATLGGVMGEESGADKNILLASLDHQDAEKMMAEVMKRYAHELYPNQPVASPKKSANTGVFEFDYEDAILKVKAEIERVKRK